jgi:predicted ferric reductase
VSFTIKALGDWSGRVVPALQPGQRVWLDGPYGVFTADRCQGPGYVLIGGGAGIAPLFSICQTLAQRGDTRPVYLFFGGHDSSRLIFRDQFGELARRMNLHTVFVLEEPGPGWTGERGYITAAMLQKYLPAQYRRFPFFICGPEPMVAAMEKMLPALGVPAAQLQTERFVMV